MTSPDTSLWASLIELNRKADALLDRVKQRVRQTPAVSREIMQVASVEVRWENLPVNYATTPSPNSDVTWGNNIKRGIFTNKGSRLYLREMGYDAYVSTTANDRRDAFRGDFLGFVPPYWLWNFQTSITQRQYADKRVSMRSLGRPESGSHLVFREPFILEPMETLTVECELLQYGAPAVVTGRPIYTVNMNFFGYREGM